MFTAREKDHEYAVDHGGDRFYIRTNGGGRRNFRLVWAPVADPRPERWTELIAHRDEVMLEDLDVFASHYVAHEREDGLIRLRVTTLTDGASHHIEFPEPTYEVGADANAEFITNAYRFRYQSLITPASVFDYNILSRERTLLKQTEVLGGYDPTQYRSERLFAVAPDGMRVPVSLVCRKETPRDGTAPMLLTGYGAYGMPYPVNFSSNRLSLLDRGYTFAIAHILVKTSLNDSQVMYWEPAKYVARMRTLNDGAPATLFKINLDAGHGGASGRYDYLREIAFDYAWVLKERI